MVFDNTIDELIEESTQYYKHYGTEPIFISDWNPSDENLQDIVLNYENKLPINKYSYLYSIDDVGYKNIHKKYCELNDVMIDCDQFSLFSNATIALYIAFKHLAMSNNRNILAFTPCYFTNDSALQSLGFKVTYYNFFDVNDFNTDEIIYIVKKNKITSILVTDPIFGMGISISDNFYKKIINFCKTYDLKLIIDYAYGNMQWSSNEFIINKTLINTLIHSKIQFYLIDSLPKKLFFNGKKFSIMYSTNTNICELEQIALFVEGSLTIDQLTFYSQCYDPINSFVINRTISSYCLKAFQNYKLIQTLLMNHDVKMIEANSSIFTTIGIPRTVPISQDMDYAKSMIKKHGIMLTPHSRYHFYDEKYFYFRVNLLLETDILLNSLTKLLTK